MMKSAIALANPKYQHNVGQAIRAASCWRAEKLIWSGIRVPHPDEWRQNPELWEYTRLPREERMRGYKDVKLIKSDKFKDIISTCGYTPVAIEVMEDAENLFDFVHPANALYIFGPEDGSLERNVLQHCHRFVKIPTAHCLNLACAINCVMMHRALQVYKDTGEIITLNGDGRFIK